MAWHGCSLCPPIPPSCSFPTVFASLSTALLCVDSAAVLYLFLRVIVPVVLRLVASAFYLTLNGFQGIPKAILQEIASHSNTKHAVEVMDSLVQVTVSTPSVCSPCLFEHPASTPYSQIQSWRTTMGWCQRNHLYNFSAKFLFAPTWLGF